MSFVTVTDKICALFDARLCLQMAAKSYDEPAQARIAEIDAQLALLRQTCPLSYAAAVRRYA